MQITLSINANFGGLEKIIANCDSMTPQIVENYGKEAEGYAKTFAPVDTGYLRDTLMSMMVNPTTARIQSNASYDIYQEMGTYKMAAQPFLSPAIEAVAERFLSVSTWRPLLE